MNAREAKIRQDIADAETHRHKAEGCSCKNMK